MLVRASALYFIPDWHSVLQGYRFGFGTWRSSNACENASLASPSARISWFRETLECLNTRGPIVIIGGKVGNEDGRGRGEVQGWCALPRLGVLKLPGSPVGFFYLCFLFLPH